LFLSFVSSGDPTAVVSSVVSYVAMFSNNIAFSSSAKDEVVSVFSTVVQQLDPAVAIATVVTILSNSASTSTTCASDSLSIARSLLDGDRTEMQPATLKQLLNIFTSTLFAGSASAAFRSDGESSAQLAVITTSYAGLRDTCTTISTNSIAVEGEQVTFSDRQISVLVKRFASGAALVANVSSDSSFTTVDVLASTFVTSDVFDLRVFLAAPNPFAPYVNNTESPLISAAVTVEATDKLGTALTAANPFTISLYYNPGDCQGVTCTPSCARLNDQQTSFVRSSGIKLYDGLMICSASLSGTYTVMAVAVAPVVPPTPTSSSSSSTGTRLADLPSTGFGEAPSSSSGYSLEVLIGGLLFCSFRFRFVLNVLLPFFCFFLSFCHPAIGGTAALCLLLGALVWFLCCRTRIRDSSKPKSNDIVPVAIEKESVEMQSVAVADAPVAPAPKSQTSETPQHHRESRSLSSISPIVNLNDNHDQVVITPKVASVVDVSVYASSSASSSSSSSSSSDSASSSQEVPQLFKFPDKNEVQPNFKFWTYS
jgi:hypothetical protein